MKRYPPLSRLGKIAFLSAGIFFLAVAATLYIFQYKPSIPAYGANVLRDIIGQQAVASIEMQVFKVQDTVRKTTFNIGLHQPSSPWQIPSSTPPVEAVPDTLALTVAPKSATPLDSTPHPTQKPSWKPAEVSQLGNLEGVGVWQPYISNNDGRVVAYRTFLQPDPDRPYATTEIVAFDQKSIRLHYQVGFAEPYAPGTRKFSDGRIPLQFLQPGILLAAFNGGFQYTHGFSGSMADGNISAPPVQGFGTVAMYEDGQLQIGEWGKDIDFSPDLVSFRQNGPLLIKNGEINPRVKEAYVWGLTVTGSTVTWRTGLAVDEDQSTLYYFVGSYITIDSLARAMTAAGAWNAIQLDINNFWPIFETFRLESGKLVPEPLLPQSMNENVERFFSIYPRDFFYVTCTSTQPDE